MTNEEQAVIEAARKCFGQTVDTETAETWLNGAVATWQTPALVDAIRRLDGYPPYGTRRDPIAAASAKRAHEGYAKWRAERVS